MILDDVPHTERYNEALQKKTMLTMRENTKILKSL